MNKPSFQDFENYSFFDAGIAAPIAVLLDDKTDTIEQHINHLVENHFSLYVTKDWRIAKKLNSRLKNDAIYFFDMHMIRVKKVNQRDTKGGVAVGFALICDITQNGEKNRIKYCSTLTEFTMEPTTKIHFASVEEAGQKIENIRKDKDFNKFCKFVDFYKKDYLHGIKARILRRNVSALAQAYQRIAPNPTSDISANLFGFRGADEQIWNEEMKTVLRYFSAADKERTEILAYILEGLILQFGRDDLPGQSTWISQKRDELENKSVWELISNGSMSDIYLAANFVNRVLG